MQSPPPKYRFGVIGRTSVMRYKLDQRQLEQIGRELKVDPMYDPLRSDPRFQDLLRRVRLNV